MNVNPTFFITMVELLAVESLALVVITVLFVRRKYQYKHAVENIIAAAESSEAAHQKVLEQTLKDVFNEGGEDANNKAQLLAKAESCFCKRLIAAFVSRKHGILIHLDKMTDELLSPYRSLISNTAEEKVQNEKKMSKNINSLKHTIESLKEEKLKITEQLAKTEHELNNIMSEYVSAFQKEEQLKRERDTEEKETEPGSDAPDKAVEEATAAADEAEAPPSTSKEDAPTETAGGGAVEGIEITDEHSAADEPDSEDEELLKLEDIDEDAATDEIPDTDDIAVTDEIMEDATIPATDAAAASQEVSAEDETLQASDAADDDGGKPETDAILEDVDINSAPLMDEIAAENSAKPRNAAAR
ncbi:MAG: hypothetical protein ACE5ET_03875 [Gammaproteobacteria bacterium]